MENYFAKPFWSLKISNRRNKLEDLTRDVKIEGTTEDFLNYANRIAVRYISDNNNFLHNILDYRRPKPRCLNYALLSYSAFLNLTQNNARDLRKNAALLAGSAIFKIDKRIIQGFHALIINAEQEENTKIFETVPANKNAKMVYFNSCMSVFVDTKNKLSVDCKNPYFWLSAPLIPIFQ